MNPWEETDAWKTRSDFFTWLRGQIRKSIWQNYPLKNEFKKDNTFPVTQEQREKYNLSGRVKKVGQCVFCKNYFPASKLQVDHIEQAGSFTTFEDLGYFIEKIACPKSNMQLGCEPCHKIKSYQDRMGISFEEAQATKQAIAIQKEKRDNDFLESARMSPASNAKERRQQIIDYLLQNGE